MSNKKKFVSIMGAFGLPGGPRWNEMELDHDTSSGKLKIEVSWANGFMVLFVQAIVPAGKRAQGVAQIHTAAANKALDIRAAAKRIAASISEDRMKWFTDKKAADLAERAIEKLKKK